MPTPWTVRPMVDAGEAIRRIDEVTELCLALRAGYLRTHPDAPRTAAEREEEHLRARYHEAMRHHRAHEPTDDYEPR